MHNCDFRLQRHKSIRCNREIAARLCLFAAERAVVTNQSHNTPALCIYRTMAMMAVMMLTMIMDGIDKEMECKCL